MQQELKLQDAGSKFRKLLALLGTKREECIVRDEQDRPVAVVMPIERYESFQAYRRRRESNFAILDRVAKKMEGYDPDYVEAQIVKAVTELKAEFRTNRQTS